MNELFAFTFISQFMRYFIIVLFKFLHTYQCVLYHFFCFRCVFLFYFCQFSINYTCKIYLSLLYFW